MAKKNDIENALFILFMVSELHPFSDGNGRISRIMMNAELVHADESKIIIPTVFREDFDSTRDYLEKCNAFKESESYILRF